MNPIQSQGELRCAGRASGSVVLVTHVVLLL